MAAGWGPYAAVMPATAYTASKTILQIKADAGAILQITGIQVVNHSIEVDDVIAITLLRKSGAATVTTLTPVKLGGAGQAASGAVGGTSATGYNASAEGTDTDTVHSDGFNLRSGQWNYPGVAQDERIIVPPSGIFGIKIAAPNASSTLSAVIRYFELG